ncbi:hypothetical protein SUDANB95_05515 [Actinosynnema sp. ALI-1.44]
MPLDTRMKIELLAKQTSPLDLATASVPLTITKEVALVNGAGAGQANLLYHKRRTLLASATEDLDLAGVLTDALGATLTFVRIKGILVVADPANSNNVVLGAAAANPWATLLNATGTLTLRPGTSFGVMAGSADAVGYTVTGATGDVLKVANSGAGSPVTYDIALYGASA